MSGGNSTPGTCERCGASDWITRDGPEPTCRTCLRGAVAAAARPDLLSAGVVKLLERDHPVLLGFDLDRSGAVRKAWRWVGP